MESNPPTTTTNRIGYVLEQYPRFSEAFVVAELLAHEAADLDVEVFSLRPSTDSRFHEQICRLRGSVTYLWTDREPHFWQLLEETSQALPGIWGALEQARGEVPQDVRQALRLALEVQRREITHLHAYFGGATGTVTWLASRFAGVPYSLTAPSTDTLLQSAHPDQLRKHLLDAAAVVVGSDHDVQSLRHRLGSAMPHIRRVYRGLDLAEYPFRAPRDRPPRIVAAGTLVEGKGFDELIQACALLHRKGILFECRILGEGPMEEELRRLVIGLGLGRSVSLLGARPPDEITRIVQQAAAVVSPSVDGGDGGDAALPPTLLEAMAAGTPVLATKVGALSEVIRHGETGVLVPPRDPTKLAAAIQRLLRDAILRVHVAVRARNLVETMFDIRRNSAELRVLFTGREGRRPKPALTAS